eukprot:Clim_evm6s227 gene=Clim_evmTU6s227
MTTNVINQAAVQEARRNSGLDEETIIRPIEQSWAKASSLGVKTVAKALYTNIFTIAPEALQLFSFKDEPDMYNSPKFQQHGAKVVGTVGVAVKKLRDLPTLSPVLQDLGYRHVKYNVTDDMYDIIGQALLKTLQTALGDDFTPEVQAAWGIVYNFIKEQCIIGAQRWRDEHADEE